MKRLLKNKKVVILMAAAVILVVAAAVVVFLLWDRQLPEEEESEEPEPIEAPVQYELNEVKVLAIPAGASVLVYDEEGAVSLAEQVAKAESVETEKLTATEENASADEPADSEDAASTEEEVETEEEAPIMAAYRYEGMKDASAMVSAYTALLTTEDMGFVIADEGLKEAEEIPDLKASTGIVYLTHVLPKNEEEGKAERQAVAMKLEWEESICRVIAELVPASLTVRPSENSGVSGFMQVLTFSGAVDRIKAMHPSVLELEGESMEDYRVYSRDGMVLINDQSCMRLDVYKLDEKLSTNVAAGNYFLSADGLHLYAFDEKEQSVRELSMTGSQLTAVEPSGDKASMPEDAVS